MKIELGYGKEKIPFEIEDSDIISVVKENNIEVTESEDFLIEKSLDNPIGSDLLEDTVKKGEKIVIITSDITRPMPSYKVLPHILERLLKSGIPYEDITCVFALGSHRKHTKTERIMLAGRETYEKIKCIDSDPNDTILLGHTTSGTPADIFSVVAKADRVIALGNIEFHYFAGYSGGIKALMPGVSSRGAISSNHSKMVMPRAQAGILEDNPVRCDMEEVLKLKKIDFICNVVLDEHKKITGVFSGDIIKAHRAGCAFLDKLYMVRIPYKADIVITTPGGYPKDINLYQAQKALDNAKTAVKDGGIVILFACCNEGMGEKIFEKWVNGSTTPQIMIEDIRENFELGGHKAAAMAMMRQKADLYCVSEIDGSLLNKIFMTKFTSLTDAYQKAKDIFPGNNTTIIMPYGASTVPFC